MNAQANDGSSFFVDYFKARFAGASFDDAMAAAGATKVECAPDNGEAEPASDADGFASYIDRLKQLEDPDHFSGLGVLATMNSILLSGGAGGRAYLESLGINSSDRARFLEAFRALAMEAVQLHLDALPE